MLDWVSATVSKRADLPIPLAATVAQTFHPFPSLLQNSSLLLLLITASTYFSMRSIASPRSSNNRGRVPSSFFSTDASAGMKPAMGLHAISVSFRTCREFENCLVFTDSLKVLADLRHSFRQMKKRGEKERTGKSQCWKNEKNAEIETKEKNSDEVEKTKGHKVSKLKRGEQNNTHRTKKTKHQPTSTRVKRNSKEVRHDKYLQNRQEIKFQTKTMYNINDQRQIQNKNEKEESRKRTTENKQTQWGKKKTQLTLTMLKETTTK